MLGPALTCCRPLVLITMLMVTAAVTFAAVFTDTIFYSDPDTPFLQLLRNPVITPLNNLLYNTKAENLALHGTHPFYLHAVANLPQLLGPAFVLLLLGMVRFDVTLVSGLFGTLVLSAFSHQEARFLLPAVPLILSSIRLPVRRRATWIGSWLVFNTVLGVLMGVYHQGGVAPAQTYLTTETNVTRAFWWKTYSPPEWMLGRHSGRLETINLMGLDRDMLEERICSVGADQGWTVLVAPASATSLDQFVGGKGHRGLELVERWRFARHLNLDDLDFGDDGVLPTLKRVVGRRGLVVWRVHCRASSQADLNAGMLRDW